MRAARIAHIQEIIPGIPSRCCEHEHRPMRGWTGEAGTNGMTEIMLTRGPLSILWPGLTDISDSINDQRVQDPYLECDLGSNWSPEWYSWSVFCESLSLGGFINKCGHHSPRSDKDCRIENARPRTETREDTPVRKQGSIHLHYCFWYWAARPGQAGIFTLYLCNLLKIVGLGWARGSVNRFTHHTDITTDDEEINWIFTLFFLNWILTQYGDVKELHHRIFLSSWWGIVKYRIAATQRSIITLLALFEKLERGEAQKYCVAVILVSVECWSELSAALTHSTLNSAHLPSPEFGWSRPSARWRKV